MARVCACACVRVRVYKELNVNKKLKLYVNGVLKSPNFHYLGGGKVRHPKMGKVAKNGLKCVKTC